MDGRVARQMGARRAALLVAGVALLGGGGLLLGMRRPGAMGGGAPANSGVPSEAAPVATVLPIPPSSTRTARVPGEQWATYHLAAAGFSMRYPANWDVSPEVPLVRPPVAGGLKVNIWNWTPNVLVKDLRLPAEEIKMEVMALPELKDYEQPGGIEAYRDLDDWLARRPLFHPDAQLEDWRETRLDGRRAVAFTAVGPLVPDGAAVVVATEGAHVYVLTAMPAYTQYRWVFEEVVRSFRFG